MLQKDLYTELGYFQNSGFFDIAEAVFVASDKHFNALAVPAGLISDARQFNYDLKLIAAVDFPYGTEVTKVRLNSINEAIKRGASGIDLTINHAYLADKKYKQIVEDLIACALFCREKDVDLRVVLEYRLFTTEEILELCYKISKHVDYLVTSTGTMLEDVLDNLIISDRIQTKTGIKVISSSSFRDTNDIDLVKTNNIFGIRLFSAKLANNIF